MKPGENALDEMNKIETVVLPQSPIGTQQMPPEIVGKSVAQLKAMGAKEVGSFNYGESASMLQEEIDSEEKQRQAIRAFEKTMQEDKADDYFVDELTNREKS